MSCGTRSAARPAAHQPADRERPVSRSSSLRVVGQAQWDTDPRFAAAAAGLAGRRSWETGISALASAVTASHPDPRYGKRRSVMRAQAGDELIVRGVGMAMKTVMARSARSAARTAPRLT
jgi:hypothetical protein